MLMAGALLAAALDLAAEVPRGGALACATVRDGRIVSLEAHGAPRDAVFRMAFLSKVVTAFTALQLVEEGRIDLNADLRRYLGDLRLGLHRGLPVTMHHLLTHTSGIDDAFFGNVAPVSGHVPTLAEHFRERPPAFGRAPGAAVLYSNEGMALAGLVVERVAGLPFAEVVRRRVFDPLCMRSSHFEQPPPTTVVPSGAEGEALVQAPSGAMVSTADDMAKLMIALLSDSAAAQRLRTPYGMFPDWIGGQPGLFHTGRSGHDSVLYLVPSQRLGLFLVHTGGLDPTLRRRFLESRLGSGHGPPPGAVQVASGTYRPILFPVHRIERVAELGSDARVVLDGDRVTLHLPPFARGRSLEFVDGITSDGYRLTAADQRFTVTGPLFDRVTFVAIPWWRSGVAQLLAFAAAFLIVVSAAFRVPGLARWPFVAVPLLLLAAPATFLLFYLPRDAATRPFQVEPSLHHAATLVLLSGVAALLTPIASLRAPARRGHAAMASVAATVLVLLLFSWNLLGYRF